MYLSLGQAAKLTGKSKSTISKALKTGKLSYISKDSKGYQIDTSELYRVYPKGEQQPVKIEQLETPRTNTETLHKIKLLEVQLEALNEKKNDLADKIKGLEADKEDYKERLDKETEERKKLTLMLGHNQQSPDKKGFFARLFSL